MLAKTFKGGRTLNGARATIRYLLNERVNTGEARILRGDSDITLAYIKQAAKKQKWSWSSGVLTFSETLTEKQKDEIIEEFERVFFPGLEKDQYNLLVVEHSDKGRTELHYIAPRIELRSGLAFNPYYVKRDLKKKDLFQDFVNLKYGFTQWQNSENVRKVRPKWAKNAKKADIKKAIDDALFPLIEEGLIENRAELILQLQEWGFTLNRTGKESITIIDENEKKHKLKGAFYGQQFDNGIAGIRAEVERRKRETKSGIRREVEPIRRELDKIIRYQAEANRERYEKDKTAYKGDRRRERYRSKNNAQQADTEAILQGRETERESGRADEKHIQQRRVDDTNRSEITGRIRSIRKRTYQRTGDAAERVINYTTTAKTDFASIAEARREREYRDNLREGIEQSTFTQFKQLIKQFEQLERDVKELAERAEEVIAELKEKREEIRIESAMADHVEVQRNNWSYDVE